MSLFSYLNLFTGPFCSAHRNSTVNSFLYREVVSTLDCSLSISLRLFISFQLYTLASLDWDFFKNTPLAVIENFGFSKPP